jgi:SAM-dependent methyltransferase
VVAADLDAEGARYAANRAGVVGFRADLSHIPLPADHFDLVMLMDVAEHFAPGEDRGLFAECARILRPGGFLFARAAAFRLLRSRHSEFAWTRQRYTRPRLLALCRDAGLEPRRATYANFLLSPIALAKFRVWEPLFDRQPSSGLKRLPGPVEAIFRGALRLEAGLIRRGVSLPFGQTVIVVSRKPAPTVPE